MISDRDVWQAAVLLVMRYGDDALIEAAERAGRVRRAPVTMPTLPCSALRL